MKDSTHMLNIIRDWNIEYGPFEDVTLVTFDVTSLYTNTPHADSPVTLTQNQWKRFIDDIFVLWLGLQEDLQTFSQYLNTVHPIKFTTASLQTEIPFLDIMMKVRNSLLQTDLHIKPTDAHNYFHHLSAHPHHCKNSIPFSQFL